MLRAYTTFKRIWRPPLPNTRIGNQLRHLVKSATNYSKINNVYCSVANKKETLQKAACVEWGKEGQPQQFPVRTTFSTFSRPSDLEILVLPLIFFKCLILKDEIIFLRIRLRKGINEILNFCLSEKIVSIELKFSSSISFRMF